LSVPVKKRNTTTDDGTSCRPAIPRSCKDETDTDWKDVSQVYVGTSQISGELSPTTSSSDVVYGLFAGCNIAPNVMVAKMEDPLVITSEEKWYELEEGTISNFLVGSIDSFVHVSKTKIIFDQRFVDLNNSYDVDDLPLWWRMNHGTPVPAFEGSSSVNVKATSTLIPGNVCWVTTRRVKKDEELRYDYVQPDVSWTVSPPRTTR
jgi:hypothetical protein